MNWEATDQFGNMYIGASDATSEAALSEHVASLIQETRARRGDSFQVTLDWGYQEINAPDPENVMFVLQVPWLASLERDPGVEMVQGAVATCCASLALDEVTFVVQ